VPDDLDRCPTTPGPVSNRGCPEVRQETKTQLSLAMDAVQFETAKATLVRSSYDILDGIVEIMRQYPDYKLAIGGHTDDIGDDERNLKLSTDRAKACYDYLIFRGVRTDRLRFAGFGETRPIADNTTPAGRERNRRVEFELTLD
jgi:outer membrane protein OmpA-like peptidoglycan-associated protein